MINVLFCGNSKVFDGILCAVLSILKRTTTKEPFSFCIYTMELTRLKPQYTPITHAQADFLQTIAKSYNSQNQVHLVRVDNIYKAQFAGCPNENCYCSPYTLLRLFLDIVPNSPKEKLLYLDADLLFCRDINLLWQIDISNVEYAAARDHYGKFLIHPNFINAGVLLFNMQKIKQTGLLAKARDLLKKKKLVFADEGAIIRCTTKKKVISQRFNDQKFLYKNTVIRHFTQRLFWLPFPHIANIKPWQVTKVHKIFGYECFDDILYEYIYQKQLHKKDCFV